MARSAGGWWRSGTGRRPRIHHRCIHQLFQAQAARTPDAVAVTCGGAAMTYAELDARANRLANHLRRLGVGPEVRVGLCLERSPELMPAILGVMKAGGAYVPLDPSHPAERMAYVLEDAAVSVLLTQARLMDRVPAPGGVRVVAVDADAETIARESAEAPETGVTSENLAYVIYTSGSTGRPKGVAMHHRGVVNYIAWGIGHYGADRGNGSPVFSSMAVDLTITNLLPLFAGKPVHLLPEENPVEALAEVLRGKPRFGLIKITPIHLSLLTPMLTAQEAQAAAHTLVIGADALSAEPTVWWQENAPGVRLMNEYGPTETVVGCSAYTLPNGAQRAGSVPVGGAIQNLTFYVLDPHGQPVPAGLPGELYIGGAGVARGYLGRPPLSAEKFVPDPFAGRGARMYRTGDRARWLADGDLVILGRTDYQVKIRGYRVEPGEIEAALRRHPSVSAALIVVREDRPGDRRLVAYVVGAADAAELREHLRRGLPEYMVPAAFVMLDALPKTATGKIDPKTLPAPEYALAQDGYAAPRTPVEEVLAQIWAQVLGAERVSVTEGFFELGGHSLLAVQVLSRVREAFGVEVPLRALFEGPTVQTLAAQVEALRRADQPAPPPLVATPEIGEAPLSFAQERLWFLDRLQPGSSLYVIPYALRLRGAVDAGALERALGEIVRRHAVLRSTFPERGGAPVQVIAPFDGFALPVEDLSALDDREAVVRRRVSDEAARPIDLAAGPVFRARLLRLAHEEHVLLLTLHHVVSDGWSMGVLFRELSALYKTDENGAESQLAPLPVQYADYARWQRDTLRGEALDRQLAWWTERLAGAPALLELPTDRPRPAVQAFRGARERIDIPAALVDRLLALGRAEGATLHMVVLAAFQLLLARYSGSDDVVVGTPVAGRARREVEGLIGFFVNTLALRTDLSGDPDFRALLRRVREVSLGAYEHQEVPFEKLVEELQPARSLSHSPLVQVVFSLDTAGAPLDGVLPGVRSEFVGAEVDTAKFDLLLDFVRDESGLRGALRYSTDLFERETIQRMLRQLERVLRQVADDPGARISALRLADADERRMLVHDRNQTDRPYPRDVCLHALFASHAAATPDAAALVWEGAELTYAQLDARANQLAHHLRRLGAGPEVRVGILMERGMDLIVAILGILKAGGAYVPLDPAYPPERLRLMVADAAIPVVITHSSFAPSVAESGASILSLDEAADAIAAERTDAPASGATAENLAYIVYTSGSTGRPKGVMVNHRTVVQLVVETDYVQFGPGDRIAQASNASFDALTFELFGALLNGATLVGIPRDVLLSPRAMREFLREQRITTLYQTTALLNQLSREHPDIFQPLREVLFGGQAADADAVRRVVREGKPRRLLHVYGPTETTAWCSYEDVRRVDDDALTVSVGRPTGNQRIYLLDAALQPVPVGVPGEAYVGGGGVVRGYLDRPALTAERFVPDPFSPEPGARMYRTGDRLRWKECESARVRECESEGTPTLAGSRIHALEFIGRLDAQVKIRGFRIEPGEIESALTAREDVREARVIVREDVPGEKRLVAYVVGAADGEALRAHLRRGLPEYMVPGAVVTLDRLPLTPNGKLDVRALPAPEMGGDESYVAPRTPVEEVLAEAWAQVLGVERAGVEDDFFALGGHSLLAIRVVSRIRELLGVELPLRALFEAPTVAATARRVEEMRRAGASVAPPVVPVERTGALPLSFAQERLWFIDRMEPGSTVYGIPAAIRLRGALHAAALERALGEIIHRHEALRTTFAEVDGAPVQVIHPFAGFVLPAHDLSAADDVEGAMRSRVAEEAARPFDLAAGPLFRPALLRLADDDHVLLLPMHHAIGDGWSVGVLLRELSALYRTYRNEEESGLPPLAVQYADFAVWQRETLRGERLERELAWWKARLDGAPSLIELPTDRPRPAVQTYRGGSVAAELSAQLVERLRVLGRAEGATLYMVLLGVFQSLLARHTGSPDVVVGTPVAGRTRGETEGLIGLFVNSLVLRTDLGGDPAFREVLRRVREVTLGAYEHQEVPFEKLVAELRPERSLSHAPLFQVLFELRNAVVPWDGLDGLRAEDAGAEVESIKFDLGLAFTPAAGGLRASLQYNADLFERATAERMLGQMARVLEQVAADADVPLSRLALLDGAERARVVEEWNRTAADFPAHETIHGCFERQAAVTPEATAVVYEGASLTYRELDARANRVAHHLRRLGVGPEVRVGLCLERGLDVLPAMLGVMKAGGAWVPLDPSHPAERMRYVLDDAAVSVLLTQDRLMDRIPTPGGVAVVSIDGAADRIAAESSDAPESGVTAENLCYVIYTSGSTGRPKGVAMHHRGVVNYIHWGIRHYGADRGNGSPVFSSMAVDLTLTNLLPLFAGRPVRFLAEENAVEALAAVLRERPRFGLIKITPTHLALVTPMLTAEEAREAAHTLVIGADFLPAEPTVWWQENAPDVRLMNEYGPTETVVGCSAYTLPNGVHRHGAVPVGGAIHNLTFYVLDAHGQPLPAGIPGELYIGGAGVARGYLDRPALSAEKFVPDPFAGEGARMYRTGDRARWLDGGNLMILGRTDSQVKVRGYRVELGEIEAALRKHEAVSGAIVVVREDAPGDRRLVAYVVSDAEPEALRDHLRRGLPEYMVPAAFVRLETLPKTATGKVDPTTLPAPEYAAPGEDYVAPRNAVEETLAAIWASVLRLDRVGVEDGFFTVGGDSILSIQVVSRARRAGVEITPRQMFEHQTIAALAAAAARSSATAGTRAEQGRVVGRAPLTPIQSWFFSQEQPAPAHYNQAMLLDVDASVSDAVLEAALAAVLEHHDALRLRYRRTESGWEQWHADDVGIALERVDLSTIPVDEQERAQGEIAGARQASLELERGPIGRAVLFERGGGRRILFIVLHHLVVDGVSWRIVRDDLERACMQIAGGEPVDLGAKSTSYRQWGAALEAYAASPAPAAESAHWMAQGAEGVAPLPREGAGDRTVAGARTVTVRLDADETRALLQEVPAAYRTQVNDVLLCALAEAIGGWTGSPRVRLALEAHGREEEIGAGVDLTRTVGWFTSTYPVVLDTTGAAGPGERLKRVKEQLRAVPMRGIGYGALRWLSPDARVRAALGAQAEPEILFNYQGAFDGGRADTLVRFAEGPAGARVAAENPRGYALEVNGGIAGGCLEMHWTYGDGAHRRESIQAVAAAYADALRGLIAHCREPGAGGYTPSDFPLAQLTQGELDALLADGRAVEDVYTLSPMQEGLLFHAVSADSLGGDGSQPYQVQIARRLQGPLDVERFRRAWAEVAARHPALRTGFAWEGLRKPLQIVRPDVELPWTVEDWTALAPAEQDAALERYLAEDAARGFRLHEAPLMRFGLFRLGADDAWFVWSQHHLILDGWAGSRVVAEAFRLYAAWSAGTAGEFTRARPYRDYIGWLRRQDQDAAERYWRGVLAGFAAPTPLGANRPASPGAEARYASRDRFLDEGRSAALEALARRAGVTVNTVLQGAWGLLLSRYAGEEDVVFGATVAGRPAELDGVEEMVGLFINTLPVRMRVRGDAPLGAWLGDLQRAQAKAREYEYAPLARVQGWSEVPGGTPLFESLFVFENYQRVSGGGAGGPLRVTGVRSVEWNSYPLALVTGPGSRVQLSLAYDESRFDADTIERMLGHLDRILEQAAAHSDVRLADLSLLMDDERRQVVEQWNSVDADCPADRTLHAWFEQQAARTPYAVAASFENETLTYAELNAAANQLAHHLRRHGVGPEVRVGLFLERSLEMVVSILATLKAGGAYVPMDPAYPADRLAHIVSDSGVPVLITQSSLAGTLPMQPGVAVIRVDADASAIAAESTENPGSGATPESLAYVIYTSGSTGKPKGALIEHRNVARLFTATDRWFGFGERDVWTLFHSCAFDFSVWEIWGALLYGGRVVVVPFHVSRDPEAFHALVRREGVTVLNQTPSAFRQFIRVDAERGGELALRDVVFGGEALEPATLREWVARRGIDTPRLVNMYGITETTVHVTYRVLTERDVFHGGGSPIGERIPDLTLYVLDGARNPLPVGVPGELYVGGAGVARGYLNRPGLTAERFIDNPFGAGRLYRTGDRVRRLADGTLEYLGRLDEQVKIRGFRIELGEIEAALLDHADVRECAVIVREDAPGDRRIVAYVVGGADADSMRDHLRRGLPEYMVPAAFVGMDALPLTGNGKLDRRALPAPELQGGGAFSPLPRNAVEERVAAVWREVLGVAQVGVHDGFFDLGGNSLLLFRVFGELRGLKADLRVVDLFRFTTLEALAAHLEAEAPRAEGGGARSRSRGEERRAARMRGRG
ncbi:MAG TPA: amino acid adenylation domain-containing protein [Longimicrobium sp.]|nr:amino acid adenylation domain-containing protein [Longimicrobium sp.]